MNPAALDMQRLRAQISGKVQGVCYRAWTQDQATALGLSGWVRNLPDGKVEWVAEGRRENLKILLERCHQGPPAARVTQVTEEWLFPEGQFKEFRIRHE